MMTRSAFKLITAGIFLTFLTVSNASAEEETRWINPHEFIGGEDAIVTASFDNPGSISVAPAVGSITHGISKRFKIKNDYELTSVQVCLRNNVTSISTSPIMGIEIYNTFPPADTGSGLVVAEDERLFPLPSSLYTAAQATEVCTRIAVDTPIQVSEGIKLLSIYFDSAVANNPAIVSAVGLGENPLNVMIGECSSTIPSDLTLEEDGTGLVLFDEIDTCAANAKNHGKYVSCVTKIANVFKKAKRITGKEKGKLTKCAAKSDIPN